MRKFLKRLFGSTVGQIYICSLINDRSDRSGPRERHVLTRDFDHVEEFCNKWDVDGRGLFVSMSTFDPKSRRVKENARETPALNLDVDLKSISLSKEDVIKLLLDAACPPSVIVDSGRGIHAYWIMDVPAEAGEAVEAHNRKLADVFGGDRQVAQSVALMRLPGTHNTKEGAWLECHVVQDTGVTYVMSQLTEWLSSAKAVIQRKIEPKPDKPEETNPFLRYAEEFSYRAPIDVEQRLADMEYEGEGDKGIHATQVAVTASLLSKGYSVDEVVEEVLEATKKVAPAGWNWVEEEKTIRQMCTGWVRKLAKREAKAATTTKAAAGGSNVVPFERAQKTRPTDDEEEAAEDKKQKPKKGVVHIILGKGFLAALKQRGDAMLVSREEVWRCTGGLWVSLSPGEAKAWIDREIEEGCRALNIVSTQKIVSETRAWVLRNPDIYMENPPWDQHGKIACRSGLLDPKTLQLEDIEPEHYVTMRIECEYDPKAKCRVWLTMLNDMFPDDKATIDAIQEIAGVGLLLDRPRQLMRALIIQGASNSGKSNLLTVLSGMFTSSPNTTTFDLLDGTHGTMDFLRNVPWVLHEAFDQAKWHFSATVKAILSGDPININIKNGPIVERRFKLPVFWATNSPPQFKEASRAIENRIRVARCKVSFDPNNPTGVAKETQEQGYSSLADYVLDKEKSGLLNWFIEGMQRAVKRGYLLDTDDMKQAAQEMRTSSNFMSAFLDDAVAYSSTHMVSMPDLVAAVDVWWKENRGEGRIPPSSEQITKAIESLYDARIAVSAKDLRHNSKRYVAGIVLNESGLELWKAYSYAAQSKGDTARISDNADAVNCSIPGDWRVKKIIQKMIHAQEGKKE